MGEREVVLDGEQTGEAALQEAVERAERAVAELKRMQAASTDTPASSESSGEAHLTERASMDASKRAAVPSLAGHSAHDVNVTGMEALLGDPMMSHLLRSLEGGKDIGHYGRLVFAMIARHFLSDEETIGALTKDPDFSTDQAVAMLRQVEGHDYSPPRRERILEWQAEQEFPILPDAADPDCGNVYRSLRFPTQTYKHIEHYQEERVGSNAG